jgi:hypothetical protein
MTLALRPLEGFVLRPAACEQPIGMILDHVVDNQGTFRAPLRASFDVDVGQLFPSPKNMLWNSADANRFLFCASPGSSYFESLVPEARAHPRGNQINGGDFMMIKISYHCYRSRTLLPASMKWRKCCVDTIESCERECHRSTACRANSSGVRAHILDNHPIKFYLLRASQPH